MEDLEILLDRLDIQNPILCGQSFGGSIAQSYTVRHPTSVRALVLSGSMVAIDLSWLDKLLCRVLFPEWLMAAAINTMSVKRFTRFSLWLGRLTRGKQFMSRYDDTSEYLEQCMLQMDSKEYLKFWHALYGFRLQPLEKISCPALILNGEFESKSMRPHTQELLRRIARAEARIIPAAHHASNMDNPQAFNAIIEDFLHRSC